MEWLLGALLSLVSFALVAWVAADLRRRFAIDPQEPDERTRRVLLGVALLLLVTTALGGIGIAYGDAVERQYKLLWLIFGPAGLAVVALALGLRAIAMRRPDASRGVVVPVLMFTVVFGIACCYGALVGGL